MNDTPPTEKRVAGYSLHAWQHTSPATRLVAPWQQAGITLYQSTRWDQVIADDVARCDLVHIHRDFPRLAKSFRQVVDQARQLGKPVLYDLDDLLLDLPDNHPDRQFHYKSDALFPVLQAIVEADAVTVSTTALQEAIRPLNPLTWLLPTCLDDLLWPLEPVTAHANLTPLVLGWIHDHHVFSDPDGFVDALASFLRQRGDSVLLRVWGCRPPESLLALPNLDWRADLPLDYSGYAALVSNQRCDVYVIPHPDQHAYLRSQSPLRFFELSACGMPGIYSQTEPYQEVIEHRRNGWLASSRDEWLTGLNALADSAELRDQIARAAQKTVSQNWLLSRNASRWLEAFNQAGEAAEAHTANLPVAHQVAHLAGQVRSWHRDLEKQISDRDWEVRALNVMLKRKERESSEYIEQLGVQLEEFWRNPAWRILNKAQQLAKRVSAPTRRASTAPAQPESPAPPAAAQSLEQAGLPPVADLSILLPGLPPARAYDVLFFSRSGWHELPESLRELLDQFTQPGSRLFFISPVSTIANPVIKPLQEQIFSIDLPAQNSQAGNPADVETQIIFFNQLRLHAGIHSAVCWIDGPAHTALPFILRNSFGWKIISSLQQNDGIPNQRCDLHIDLPLALEHTSELQAAVQDLFPKASLIILTYNNLDYTRQCLESIFSKTIYPNYEIVVVDNASTDGTSDYLQTVAASHSNVRLVLNKENRGFAAGNNQGVAASSGEYIAYLNNDIIVTPGWLSGLIAHLSDPSIGAVGPVTNYAGNESRIAVDYHQISDLDEFAHRYTQAHAGQSFEIRMLALFCMLVHRTVIDSVGPLDEQFGVGMYEDDDFSLRIRQKGYRILCAEDVYIHHWGSAAFSQLAQERFNRLHLENRGKFESKWGTLWQPPRWRMDEA